MKCVLTGKSKQFLGKAYTKECINKHSADEVDKLFSNFQAKHYRFGSFLTPLSVGLITSWYYLSEWGTENGDKERDK